MQSLRRLLDKEVLFDDGSATDETAAAATAETKEKK